MLSGTADIVIGNIEWNDNKTIAEVRGLGPIFTTTAAVSTDANTGSFDSANHRDDLAAYYVEINVSTASSTWSLPQANIQIIGTSTSGVHGIMHAQNTINTVTGYDGTNFSNHIIPVTAEDTLIKLGKVYEAGTSQQTYRDGINTWTDFAYDGAWDYNGLPIQMKTQSVSFKMRNLQRYDIASYAEGKTIIDGLMA